MPVLPGEGATAWPVPRAWMRTEVTGVVTPVTVPVAVVTTAWPVPSTWVRPEVTGVVMLSTVPPSEVTVPPSEGTVPWPAAAS